MGTTPDPEYESSPDVAVDGSVQTAATPGDEGAPKSGRVGLFSNVFSTVRATLLAPLGLFRRYLAPLLAFALVLAAALYVLGGL